MSHSNLAKNEAVAERVPPISIIENKSAEEKAHWEWIALVLGAAFALVSELLSSSGRMVREVGPNSRPLERHEFENLEHRSFRGPIL